MNKASTFKLRLCLFITVMGFFFFLFNVPIASFNQLLLVRGKNLLHIHF